MANPSRIAVLTCLSPHAWIMINALVEQFGPVTILNEKRQDKWALIRNRAKRQGVVTVLGQIGFVTLQKFIDRRQQGRVSQIVEKSRLNARPNPDCEVIEIGSVNDMACRVTLAERRPDVVVVLGTRIIGRETLKSITVPVINAHAGWNPAYRGQAGGYWALARGDLAHAGVTIHLVDEGVDTGAILYQERFEPTPDDSFGTYFYLQAAVAGPLLVKAVEDAKNGDLHPHASTMISHQYFHPTLWGYLWTALTRGVW